MRHLTMVLLAALLVPAAGGDADVPLFEGLGTHSRTVSGSSALGQRYFDQGLRFLYGFNHDEAMRAFRKASELDPRCAMAWWGVAAANGPHINRPAVPLEREQAGMDAVRRARALAEQATEEEKTLIEAMAARFAIPQPADRAPLDRAYAKAMRAAWKRYPNDTDVGALYAESLMDLRPWDLWTRDGKPQPETPEILATLERVMAMQPGHPLALHLYIHAVEAGPTPGKGAAAADRLRDLMPSVGHMVHMPSHIDVRLGAWEKALTANTKAIAADEAYRAVVAQQDFYRVYMAHNHHMLGHAAMMMGRSADAIRVMDQMVARIPPEWASASGGAADGFMAMPLEARVRFGRWEEVLAAPDLPEGFPIARALRHVARGIALAATGRVAEARTEEQAFEKARARVPGDAFFGNNRAADLLAVAGPMLEGEILYKEGKHDEAFAALRRAVDAEDALRYDEPPDWILPVRHALGAALLESGRAKDAEQIYLQDLTKLPHNGWSLLGLSRSLSLQGRSADASKAQARFEKAWAGADVKIASSCLCQPGTAPALSYVGSIEQWRRQREDRLRSDTGWLTVAGLYWLKEGWNTFGSDVSNAIVLPASAPARAGLFEFREGRATLRLEPGIEAMVSGKPVRTDPVPLKADDEGDPDLVQMGDLTMFVIRRGDRHAIRLRDRNSKARREFAGLRWYPVSPGYRVEARWEAYDPPRMMKVPNILGFVEESPCPGAATFELGGKTWRLEPILEEPGAEELFFIFKDATAGRETYGAGRFLYADLPKDGRVTLDFNKAYTPPCGFTSYATCPLPPDGNKLTIPIEAGEKFSGH
ncbi:MAG: DUF1684 domain-containing protein [Candidatus Polarisedimenticolia bacterium]